MSKIDLVRSDMMAAMKAKDKAKKDALSALLTALKNAAIDKRSDLTEDEENSIVLKEIKTLKESIDSAPTDRTEFIEECKFRIGVIENYAPTFMSEDEINATIQGVLNELGITTPEAKDKGKIMKALMPKVKGKADSTQVNALVSKLF